MVTFHSTRLERTTTASFSCHDISGELQAFVEATGIRNGCWWPQASTPPPHWW